MIGLSAVLLAGGAGVMILLILLGAVTARK